MFTFSVTDDHQFQFYSVWTLGKFLLAGGGASRITVVPGDCRWMHLRNTTTNQLSVRLVVSWDDDARTVLFPAVFTAPKQPREPVVRDPAVPRPKTRRKPPTGGVAVVVGLPVGFDVAPTASDPSAAHLFAQPDDDVSDRALDSDCDVDPSGEPAVPAGTVYPGYKSPRWCTYIGPI